MRAFDAFKDQLPDIDPEETAEWIGALDDIIDQNPGRAEFLIRRLMHHARARRIGVPSMVSTHYINTISPEAGTTCSSRDTPRPASTPGRTWRVGSTPPRWTASARRRSIRGCPPTPIPG